MFTLASFGHRSSLQRVTFLGISTALGQCLVHHRSWEALSADTQSGRTGLKRHLCGMPARDGITVQYGLAWSAAVTLVKHDVYITPFPASLSM